MSSPPSSPNRKLKLTALLGNPLLLCFPEGLGWMHFGRELPGNPTDTTPGLGGRRALSHYCGHPGLTNIWLPLHFFSSVWKVWALGALWSLTSSWSRWNMELVQVAWMRGDCSCFRGPRRSGWLFRCRQPSDIPTSFHSGSLSGQGFGLSQAGRPFSGGLKDTTWWGCWHCQDGAERKWSGRQALPGPAGAGRVPGPFHPTAGVRCTGSQPRAWSPLCWTACRGVNAFLPIFSA